MNREAPDPCRILLVDDHKLLMEGVRSLLAPHPHLRVAGMAQDGGEGVAMAASLAPDLVVMDLSMPRMNGVEASRAVMRVLPETRILIYTGHEDQRFLPELIEAGIMGHVRKSEPPAVLLRALEALRRGEIFLTFPDPGGVFARLLRERREYAADGRDADISVLSPREKEIFRMLADGAVPRQIAEQLRISPKTAETHKYNIMTKLRAASVGDLVKIALRCGLIRL